MRTARLVRLTLAISFACGAGFAPLAAQQTPRAIGAAGGPSVTIDFLAVDAKGEPVRNLTAADVTVRIDGKDRTVRDLRFIARDAPAAGPAVDPPPAPFATNQGGDATSRSLLVIFDNETMPAGREARVKEAISAMLRALGPRDVAAIVTVPHGGTATDFTNDRAKLLDAADKLMGAKPNTETADEAACRSRLTVQAVTGLLNQRGGAEQPLDVIFVTSGLVGPQSNVTTGRTTLGRGTVGGCDMPNDEFTKLGAAAAQAHARVFIVQPERPIGTATAADSQMAGLEAIASITGGDIWHMAGSDEPGFQRILRQTSGFYTATVDLDGAERGGPTRQVSFKTSRPDVTLRARPVLTMGRAAGDRAGNAPSPKDMMKTATVYRDLPMRVAAFAARNAGDGRIRIMTVAEPATPGTRLSAASIGMYDAAGKLVAQWTATAQELTAPALITAFIEKAGSYRIRVAATDAANRAGTADVDLNATLTPAAGALSLSSMMIGTNTGGFAPKLQFTTEPSALAYFELYGGQPGMPVSITLELASSLNGPALAKLERQIARSETEADLFRVIAPINLGSLPPGDYVVRAIVGLDGQPSGRIVRTLRKAQ